MSRVTITLQEAEKSALLALSEREKRDPRRQAALIIRQALEKGGWLQPEADAQPIKGVNDGNIQ